MITHDLAVARHARRIIQLRDGAIVDDTLLPNSSSVEPSRGPSTRPMGVDAEPGGLADLDAANVGLVAPECMTAGGD